MMRQNHLSFITTALFLALICLQSAHAQNCTFSTYQWNVQLKKSINHQRIDIPRSQLSEFHFDPVSGCSVCEQDQHTIQLDGMPAFRLCKLIAPRVESVLHDLQRQGFPLFTVTGYRVGMTRGEPDQQGNRTRFSNHSFGIALDINAQLNGLYDRCIHFGPHCRLIMGGQWKPGLPGSILPDGMVVRAMRNIGLRWGGQISGKQKDFMHFSLSGY